MSTETAGQNDFTAKVIWESEARNKDGRPYMTVKQTGYYVFSERLGVDSVAFILLDRNNVEKPFGLISERKPPLDERMGKEVMLTTAFGGSIDSDNSFAEIVQIEAREEAGYDVPLDKIIFVGDVMVSTQSNQMCHLYFVDVSDVTMGEREPENEMEAMASTVWCSSADVANGHDWKAITILSKAMQLSVDAE